MAPILRRVPEGVSRDARRAGRAAQVPLIDAAPARTSRSTRPPTHTSALIPRRDLRRLALFELLRKKLRESGRISIAGAVADVDADVGLGGYYTPIPFELPPKAMAHGLDTKCARDPRRTLGTEVPAAMCALPRLISPARSRARCASYVELSAMQPAPRLQRSSAWDAWCDARLMLGIHRHGLGPNAPAEGAAPGAPKTAPCAHAAVLFDGSLGIGVRVLAIIEPHLPPEARAAAEMAAEAAARVVNDGRGDAASRVRLAVRLDEPKAREMARGILSKRTAALATLLEAEDALRRRGKLMPLAGLPPRARVSPRPADLVPGAPQVCPRTARAPPPAPPRAHLTPASRVIRGWATLRRLSAPTAAVSCSDGHRRALRRSCRPPRSHTSCSAPPWRPRWPTSLRATATPPGGPRAPACCARQR